MQNTNRDLKFGNKCRRSSDTRIPNVTEKEREKERKRKRERVSE